MKKYIKYSVAAMSAITILSMSVSAFAENTPEQITGESMGITDEVINELNYSILDGTIKDIKFNENGLVSIEFSSIELGDIILNESKGECMVIEGTTVVVLNALEKDMTIKVVMDNNAPMTMSYPGQTGGAVAIIVNGDKFVAVDKFDGKLIGSSFAISIGENNKIIDVRGTKQIISQEDIIGHECLIIFGASTKSIPAQTTPDIIVVLDNAKPDDTIEVKSVALRRTFEELGYEIPWESNDKPIIITNGTVSAEITVGKDTITIGKDIKELSSIVKIVNGVTYVPGDMISLFK